MPRLSPIDASTDAPIRRFLLTDKVQSLRLQTGVTYDQVDPKTNQLIPGKSSTIMFDSDQLATNRPDWIEAIEKSYAYSDGLIADLDVIESTRKDAREAALVKQLSDDPKFAARLQAKLLELLPEQAEKAAKPEKTDPPPNGVTTGSFGKGSRTKKE